ncbi:hypothetical protein C1H69_00755 [Billgrantia endophytica]|uniref:Insertion element IS402-like domain-containing protein n=1 Tax=Billgrantia endophytica TaxID=2033802 RepID=A0A2N7UBQ9_9GAMM|nr:hypothetical protein C1H69_00755 [Halomonas endophytica]
MGNRRTAIATGAPQAQGRARVSNRAALTGILFVLKSGIPWEMLLQEMGCGSGVTYWRRLQNIPDRSPGSPHPP